MNRFQLPEQGEREFLGQSLADPTQCLEADLLPGSQTGVRIRRAQTSQEHPESDRSVIKVGTLVYSEFFFLIFCLVV